MFAKSIGSIGSVMRRVATYHSTWRARIMAGLSGLLILNQSCDGRIGPSRALAIVQQRSQMAGRRKIPKVDSNPPYLSLSITRRTCPGSHIPRPVAVGKPSLLSSMAIPYHDVIPLRRSSATIGASWDARASARAIATLRPASPVLDFPVSSMASRGNKNPRGG
jgi:hypothetical protein